MIRTQVYFTPEQMRDIKLRAKREDKAEAEVIRELVELGFSVSENQNRESTGEGLLRLAKLGEKLQVKSPPDVSSRIDDILYGEK